MMEDDASLCFQDFKICRLILASIEEDLSRLKSDLEADYDTISAPTILIV